MKKTVMKEVTLCDCCQKEGYLTACINCKVEHCHDCTKTEGKTYVQAINYGGTGDGYYCKNCDIELMNVRNNPRHAAYRKIASLRNEAKAWSDDFRARADEAENELKALRA